ncbi:MAG: excinuclease ABC subunit UvrC [Flavobacteriales bacterium]|nr:excinuclease ABC subunit UvrC [Flavobacteriales bacterium]MBK9287388.1 excinuclease ABC subunit UvrC [Flavobacteriales bacterium]MBL0036202.1 excinuclease ABC subunit UvrC [Flavobacteriales bacterium]
MTELDVRDKVRLLPHNPGVYQFFDVEGKILYVGKAKDLRNRVSSYFAKSHTDGKTAALVRKIVDLRTIVVPTEFEALLLENSLIKEHQPRYNILLRDDKSFPWIRIRNEALPRIEGMRNPEDDGSEYYGPYAGVRTMRTVLDLVHKLYKLRTCSYDLTPKNIEKGKFKRCLEYHIGNCKAPCEGLQSAEEYETSVALVRQIVKGRVTGVIKLLKELMHQHADKLEFEEAEELREKIERLESYRAKSIVVNPDIGDVDVYGLAGDTSGLCVNYMRVIDGAVVHGITIELKRRLDETEQELLQLAIAELRQRYLSNAAEAIVPFDPGIEVPGVHFTVPQRGDKKQLLELCERNAQFFFLDKQKQEKLVDPEAATNRILEQLKQDLRLPSLPVHIECFDNSNTQGTDPVSACVVFRDAKPSKKDYRHFNIRTVVGPDDFASMEEAVERRYSRMLREGEPLPQLIVIDGGKGQLSSAMNSIMRLGLRGKVAVIGIAKKLEEIYFPDDPVPLHIDKRSSSLRVIQQMRNEAHRFGITHHRSKRGKRVVRTALQEIPGIGPETARKLLIRFGSIKGIQEATVNDLIAEVGERKAALLKEKLGAQ